VTCGFSKWCECFPMRTQEAEEIADILFSQIFSRYGACRTLVTDRHYSNLSKIINILCKMFNITQHFTSSYHPQSNVACERMNSLIAIFEKLLYSTAIKLARYITKNLLGFLHIICYLEKKCHYQLIHLSYLRS